MSYFKFDLTILLIVLCYSNYTSGIIGQNAADCQEYQFWGNCNKDALCLCYTGLWYSSTVSSINGIMPSVTSFSNVCRCDGGVSPIQKCVNQNVHLHVITQLINQMPQSNDQSCTALVADNPTTSQPLTSESATTSTTLTTNVIPSSTVTSAEVQTQTGTGGEATMPVVETMCPCLCDYMDKIVYWRNETNQLRQYYELSERLAQLKRLLSVNRKNLSSTVNKKISADDERPSASVTGYVGAVFIALFLVGMALADAPVLIRQTSKLLKDIRKLCARK